MGKAWKHTSPVCYVYAATVAEAVLGTCSYTLHGNTTKGASGRIELPLAAGCTLDTTHFLSNTLAMGCTEVDIRTCTLVPYQQHQLLTEEGKLGNILDPYSYHTMTTL